MCASGTSSYELSVSRAQNRGLSLALEDARAERARQESAASGARSAELDFGDALENERRAAAKLRAKLADCTTRTAGHFGDDPLFRGE